MQGLSVPRDGGCPMARLSLCRRTRVVKYVRLDVNVSTKTFRYPSLLPPPRASSNITCAVPSLSCRYTIQSSVTMASPSVVKVVPERSIMLICDMQTRFRTSRTLLKCNVYSLYWLCAPDPQVPR